LASGITRRAALAGAASLAAFGARAATAPTLFISHPATLAHDPGPGWPDSPERLRALFSALDDPRFAALARLDAPQASREALLRVHAPEHLARLEEAAPKSGRAQLGADVVMSAGSYEAALRAAGGAVAARSTR
jgi:acetoin utilization deacetylase AcuC-like enzyme